MQVVQVITPATDEQTLQLVGHAMQVYLDVVIVSSF